MALSAHQGRGANHRQQAGYGRLARRRVSQAIPIPAGVPRPVGHPPSLLREQRASVRSSLTAALAPLQSTVMSTPPSVTDVLSQPIVEELSSDLDPFEVCRRLSSL